MRAQNAFRMTLTSFLVVTTGAAFGQGSEDGLPIGSPVAEVGTTYVADEFGDWEIRCIRAEEGRPEPCQMYQLLLDEGGNPVAEFNIFELPDEGQVTAGATVVTPLDTLLTPGIRVRVDDGPASGYPFAFCQPVGCFARMGLTDADLDAFRAGGDAYISLVPLPAPDQVIELEASLIGFTAGFEDLTARQAAALELMQALQAEAAATE
jgi:invasion protein IalB